MTDWFARDLTVGDEGDDVGIVQRKLFAPVTGVFDQQTAAHVRGFQRKHGLQETGIVDKQTAKRLGEKAAKGRKPGWFEHPLEPGDACEHVEWAREAFRLPLLPAFFDDTLEQAVRRFQAATEGLKATGRLDVKTAVAFGNRSV